MVLAATFAKFIIFGLTQQISRWNRDVPPFASSNLTGKLPPAALGCAGDERAPSGDKSLCKIHLLWRCSSPNRVMTAYSYPSVVVFDLDYTLWPFWCDYHVDSNIKRVTDSELKDSSGYRIALCPDVELIIKELVAHNVTIVSASRTPTPHIAKRILSLLKIDGKPMIQHFDSLQWGEGSKIRHITRAVEELGLEKELEAGSMILFDDEARNRDVELIGCHFAFIEDYKRGLTRPIFEKALKTWSEEQK